MFFQDHQPPNTIYIALYNPKHFYNWHKVIHALYLSFTKQKGYQVFDSYVHSMNYALLAITELPNNELTGIHTLSLPPLLL